MTSFDGAELAEVIAAALLGRGDDEEVPTVEVLLPNGQRRVVTRVWYEATNTVVLELHDESAPLRRLRNLTDSVLDDLLEREIHLSLGRRSPLRSVRHVDPS